MTEFKHFCKVFENVLTWFNNLLNSHHAKCVYIFRNEYCKLNPNSQIYTISLNFSKHYVVIAYLSYFSIPYYETLLGSEESWQSSRCPESLWIFISEQWYVWFPLKSGRLQNILFFTFVRKQYFSNSIFWMYTHPFEAKCVLWISLKKHIYWKIFHYAWNKSMALPLILWKTDKLYSYIAWYENWWMFDLFQRLNIKPMRIFIILPIWEQLIHQYNTSKWSYLYHLHTGTTLQ